jgi:hypothetical protein
MNLWNKPEFPKCDWKHVDVIDVAKDDPDAALHSCEACGRQDVRYVHQLEHEFWNDTIEVGCICAGKLTGDLEEARRLEKEAKNKTNRRERWLERPWKISRNGNHYLKFRHQGARYHIIVFKSKYGKWNFRATVEEPGYQIDDPSPFAPINPLYADFEKTEHEGSVWYKTQAEAKLAAFDELF